MRFVHTNIIAKDWKKLSLFYQKVFSCKPVPPQRDLKGDWLDRLTGLKGAHITGEHLALPGYDGVLPTLEIYSYDDIPPHVTRAVNGGGLAHLAFEVEDVAATLEKILQKGGGQRGELVTAEYPGGVIATFVYATDVEGNIVELQNWQKNG